MLCYYQYAVFLHFPWKVKLLSVMKNTLHAARRQKKIILLTLVVFLALGLVFTFASDPGGQTTVSLLLRFDNINRGYYPDGSSFNKEDLISQEIAEKVVQDLDLEEEGIRPSVLRRHLDVVGAMSRGDLQEAERMQREGRSPDAMFPSEYRISLLEGEQLGLEQSRQEEILLAVVDAYTDRFRRVHFGLESPLPALYLEAENIQEYDYPFIPDIMTARIDQLKDFVEEMEERSSTFRSSELGYSFSDVDRELENIQEERVGYIRSVIQEGHLTVDPEGTLRRYLEKVDELEERISRKEQEASFARELLRELEEEMAEEPPLGEDMADIVEVLLKHDYHTTLLTRSLEAGMEVEELKVERDYYLAEAQQLAGEPLTDEVNVDEEMEALEMSAFNPSPELMERMDQEIELTMSRIENYLEVIEVMRREMLEQEAERAIYILRSPHWQSAGRPPVQLLAAWLFFGLMAGCGLAYYRETFQNKGRQNKGHQNKDQQDTGYQQASPTGGPDKSNKSEEI